MTAPSAKLAGAGPRPRIRTPRALLDDESTTVADVSPPAPPGFAELLVGGGDPRGKVLRPSNFSLTKPDAGWSHWHSAGFFQFAQTY
eukprot:SAG31_NODE_20859_length_564_cov_0.709677_2_plen_86_part_01